jgi:hypothetical protein
LSDNSYDTDLTALSDSDIDSSDLEYDPDDEILAEDDKKFIHSHMMLMIHALMLIVFFSDVKQCKEAIIQHAILNDHAIRPIKTDKDRFRAVCSRADKGCLWNFLLQPSRRNILGAS